MKLYKVSSGSVVRYAGSMAEVKVHRDNIVEITGCKKKDVFVADAEVGTSKSELLPFINELCKLAD